MGTGDYLALAAGALNTIAVSVLAIAIGTPLGLGLALIRWGQVRGLDSIVAIAVSCEKTAAASSLPICMSTSLSVIFREAQNRPRIAARQYL